MKKILPDYSVGSKRLFGYGYRDLPKGCSKTPEYKRWASVLQRCYATPARQPTYEDCYVCDEWAYLSNFSWWMKGQDWEGKHLDKDLLGDTYEYSPTKCCFISPRLNMLIEPRGVPVDMSDKKRREVSELMGKESDPRVIEALSERYNL